MPAAVLAEASVSSQVDFRTEASVWLERRRYDKAAEALGRALAAEPDDAELHALRCDCLRRIGGRHARCAARAHAETALRLAPNAPIALRAMMLVQWDENRLEEAERYGREAIARATWQGQRTEMLGLLSQLLVSRSQSLSERVRNGTYYTSRGTRRARSEAEQLRAEAENVARQGLQTHPENFSCRIGLCRALLLSPKHRLEADVEARRLLALWPNDAETHRLAAEAAAGLDNGTANEIHRLEQLRAHVRANEDRTQVPQIVTALDAARRHRFAPLRWAQRFARAWETHPRLTNALALLATIIIMTLCGIAARDGGGWALMCIVLAPAIAVILLPVVKALPWLADVYLRYFDRDVREELGDGTRIRCDHGLALIATLVLIVGSTGASVSLAAPQEARLLISMTLAVFPLLMPLATSMSPRDPMVRRGCRKLLLFLHLPMGTLALAANTNWPDLGAAGLLLSAHVLACAVLSPALSARLIERAANGR